MLRFEFLFLYTVHVVWLLLPSKIAVKFNPQSSPKYHKHIILFNTNMYTCTVSHTCTCTIHVFAWLTLPSLPLVHTLIIPSLGTVWPFSLCSASNGSPSLEHRVKSTVNGGVTGGVARGVVRSKQLDHVNNICLCEPDDDTSFSGGKKVSVMYSVYMYMYTMYCIHCYTLLILCCANFGLTSFF